MVAHLGMQALVEFQFFCVAAAGIFCPGVEMARLESLDEFLANYERKPDERETTIAVALGFSDMTGKSLRTDALVRQLLMHCRTSALAAMPGE